MSALAERDRPCGLRLQLEGLRLSLGQRDGHCYAVVLEPTVARALAADLLEQAARAELAGDVALGEFWSKIGGSA